MPKFNNPFLTLGLPERPVILAPLAGVSDHPFRRICTSQGADLTYVEMISATALVYQSQRTFDMLERHESEARLGVQVTGRNAEDTAKAFEILNAMSFDTIDINMGCPVGKVVKTGCGSAILKDPERVLQTVRACRNATDKPFSCKIRLGWDRNTVNVVEVVQAIADGGADWIVVHGRTRSDDYSVPVDLDAIASAVAAVDIPVIGNGNVFGSNDCDYMGAKAGVAGVMISRGALGDPWSFARAKGRQEPVNVAEWHALVRQHLLWQEEAYGNSARAAVCMRKHLLWYCKGWPGIKIWKDEITRAEDLASMLKIMDQVCGFLEARGLHYRDDVGEGDPAQRFQWDPKWDMDRQLDRGVGTDMLANGPEILP